MIASVFLGDVKVIRCISKIIVPIKLLRLCVSVFDFLIILFYFSFWDTYAYLQKFYTLLANLLLLLLQCTITL